MSKLERIKKIIKKNAISPEFIDEIVIKDEKTLIISINCAFLSFSREKLAKISEKIKENMTNKLGFEKVTIVLLKDENKIAQKTDGGESFLEKIITFIKIKTKREKKLRNQDVERVNNTEPLEQSDAKKASSKHSEVASIKSVKKIIAVASAKGGVGKSTFAVNLAASLKKIGHRVALVDADIYGPSIPHLMNLKGKPEIKDGLFIPLISQGIKCMSIGFIIEENSAGVWRGPMITKILHQLIKSVSWNFDGADVDYMIVDMPPGTGDVYLSLAQTFPLNGVVIVSTPQSVAVADVVRSIDCFNKLQVPILGLVQNMAFLEQGGEKQYIFGKDNAKNMAQKYGLKFLGDIALSQEISDSSEERIPFVAKNPSSNLAMIYGKIAEDIID